MVTCALRPQWERYLTKRSRGWGGESNRHTGNVGSLKCTRHLTAGVFHSFSTLPVGRQHTPLTDTGCRGAVWRRRCPHESRQLTRCTLLARSDIMVAVKLLYSCKTVWCWLFVADVDSAEHDLLPTSASLEQCVMVIRLRGNYRDNDTMRYAFNIAIFDMMWCIVPSLLAGIK